MKTSTNLNKTNKLKRNLLFVGGLLSVFFLTACKEPPVYTVELKGTKIKAKEFAHCNDLVPYGFPQNLEKKKILEKRKGNENSNIGTTYFVCHDRYVSEFNPFTITPMWTAEHLYGKDLKENKDKEERISFEQGGKDKGVRPDPKIPSFSGEPEMYYYEEAAEKGYIPHKLAAIKNHLRDIREQSQTFYLTNYYPIYKENKEFHLKLEKYVRDLIEKYEEGYVFTGTIYTSILGKSGIVLKIPMFKGKQLNAPNLNKGLEEEHYKSNDSVNGFLVPRYVFKMVYFPKIEKTMTFIIPNTKLNDLNISNYRNTLSNLEKITKIDFFPDLSKNKKEKLLN